MIFSIIVAAAENDVIGKDGKMPWHMSSDLKTFRRLTMGKPIVMGRRTFASIGKPLDGRDNIVVTRDPFFEVAGVSACASVGEALTLARVMAMTRGADEVMIIGGAQIYDCVMDDVSRIYFTRVHATPEGDRYFATPDPQVWREVSREALPKGGRDDYNSTLIVYERAGGELVGDEAAGG